MTHRGAHTCRGMGCSDSRVCSGGLCSRQAAGVLRLDLHSEFFCRHQIVGHGRLVVGWLFVERHARLLVFLIMLTAAPQIADNAAGAAVESEVHSCRALDYRQRVELVQLSVQQRREYCLAARALLMKLCLSVAALRRTHSRPAPVSLPFERGSKTRLAIRPKRTSKTIVSRRDKPKTGQLISVL